MKTMSLWCKFALLLDKFNQDGKIKIKTVVKHNLTKVIC
jgi:hypothetical protein